MSKGKREHKEEQELKDEEIPFKSFDSAALWCGQLQKDGSREVLPQVLVTPARYVQGIGIISHIGRYLSLLPSTYPAVIISKRGRKRFEAALNASFHKYEVTPTYFELDSHCSYEVYFMCVYT